MQALLSEIRQLRQDLQVAAIAARRAQIVIYRLPEQEMAVERATERLENAKSALAQIQMQHKYNAENLKRLEENEDRFENEQERKQYTDECPISKMVRKRCRLKSTNGN
jgi:HAMP domain-containing protein